MYEWELGGTGNDQIDVAGDLVLGNTWEVEITILPDFIGSIDSSDQFTLITYTGDLTANTDALGGLNQVVVNGSALDSFELDTTNAGVFDDGEGTVYLTGLVSIPAVLKGDVDLDGDIGFGDIPAFIAVLQSGVFQAEADCDCSTVVDFGDIPAFIAILQSQ